MFDYYDGVRILRDKTTKMPIGIEWRLDDGSIEKYYPDNLEAEWFADFVNSVREESNSLRRSRYNCISLDAFDYEGELFASKETPSNLINISEEQERISKFLSTLTKVEIDYLSFKLDDPSVSFRDIAKLVNKSATAIHKTFLRIRRKYQVFYDKIFLSRRTI